MKVKLYCLLITGLLCGTINASSAQKNISIDSNAIARIKSVDSTRNQDWSLSGQYKYLLSRSKSVNGYKLVNPYRLATFWKSINDTLASERKKLNAANAKIAEQSKSINNNQTSEVENNVEVPDNNDIVTSTDSISFLGMDLSKGQYHTFVWSIIFALAVALFVVIARSAKNISEAKLKTELYEDLTSEFQRFKSKTNEKERKLARELQDERNLVEEMKNSKKS